MSVSSPVPAFRRYQLRRGEVMQAHRKLTFFLLIVFRIAGRRTLSETTTFDLVMLLIISQTKQQAMLDNDQSVTNGFVLILTLVGTSLLSVLKIRFHKVARLIDGLPVVVVSDGKVLKDK
jgi:uncharacterized membrane protein YcaP (DUF421 family)